MAAHTHIPDEFLKTTVWDAADARQQEDAVVVHGCSFIRAAATESNYLTNKPMYWSKSIVHIFIRFFFCFLRRLFHLQFALCAVSLKQRRNVARIKWSHLKVERWGNPGTTAADPWACEKTWRFKFSEGWVWDILSFLSSTQFLKLNEQKQRQFDLQSQTTEWQVICRHWKRGRVHEMVDVKMEVGGGCGLTGDPQRTLEKEGPALYGGDYSNL